LIVFILAEALTLKPNVYPDESAGEDSKKNESFGILSHVIFF
jgi:hypothetical protein